MKKSTLFVCAAALVLAGFVSCTKESTSDNSDSITNQQPGETVNPADENPQDETLPEGMIRLNFALTSEMGETSAEEGSKTSWDGSSHTWSDGDQIRIIWGEDESSYVDAVVENGRVSALVGDADYYYAVYPTTATYTYTAAEGKISVKFERGQSGSFSDANIMAAKTSKAAASFAFKNMTGIIKFSLAAESPYKTINFSANDKAVLNGWVDTTFPDTFAVTTRDGANTGKDAYGNSQYNNMLTVTGLRAGETYYVAVLPGVELENGIGFNVYKSGSQSTGALSTGSLTIARGAVKTLPVIDNQIHESWFITENGTGKGTSWEDAGGPERLVQLIYPTQTRGAGAGLTAAWRLHKSTIYVAAGTYNIQAANDGAVLDPHYNTGTLNFTIKGGYPTGLSGTATTGQDPKNNATNFICNQTATTDHIFELSGTNKVNVFSFDGITFTANPSATETNIDGIALNYTSSSVSNITFKNCIFTGLTGSTGTSNYNGGAAINFNSEAAATLLFDGCAFSDNTAARGGVAAIRNRSTDSNIKFKDCTFIGNIANGNQGGAIYVYANAAPVVFDHSSFSGDGTTNNAANGGAICVVASGNVTVQNGCSFTNLLTGGNGGAIFNHGSVVFDNSSITSCKAKMGGAIYSDNSVEIRNGSTFTGNDATNNGGCIYNAKDLSIDASTIKGKGKTTDMTALLGGGIYNTNAGTATLSNGTVIEDCAITGSSHHGAAIWNAGVLGIDGCIIRNNKNNQRGAGIYGVKTTSEITVSNTLFSDNDAANGGAVALDDGASAFINGCTISGSDATNGSALRTATNSGTNVNKFVVFNTLIEGNVSASSTSPQSNATVQLTGYGSALLANCTIRNNTTPGSTAALTVNGSNGKLYVVSCTMSENGADITRTSNTLEVHNSILTGLADNPLNVVIEKSYWYGHLYGASRSDMTDGVSFALGSYDSNKGVYPLNSTYSTVYNAGMSVTDLQALSFNNITLTEDQLALLAKDQKGNDRNGTIMGAYVLNE